MKLAKSLLLGSAAALMAGTAAQAADLPFKKAAPVEYVRVCDWTGAGYFYIPGTDTCLKIGGFVRAEFQLQSGGTVFVPNITGVPGGARLSGRQHDQTGFFVRGRLTTDARTQTAYGTLRTYIQAQFDRFSGSENGTFGGASSSTYIDKAFIQFAGITAGRVQSFFDFGADPYGFGGIATSDYSTQAFAYTANFAGGFSATVAVEDANGRRGQYNFGTPIQNSTFGGVTTSATMGGSVIPDLVGALRVDQAWGSAQLSGVYHQLNTVSTTAHKDADGFSVRGAVLFKLPFLAAGDEFQVEGGYGSGAYNFTNSNGLQSSYGGIEGGGYVHQNADAIAISNGVGGYNLAKAESYSVSGGLAHFFTPNVQNIVFGSYEHVEYGRASRLAWYAGGEGPADSYRIADQINWFPVKGLQIGLEVMYINTDQKVPGTPGTPAPGYATVALPAGVAKNTDSLAGRLRIERDF